jgi:hypothetical protein
MKKSLIPLTLLVSALFLFTACDSPRSLDQMLENDSDRSNIMSSIINHQPYRLEMVNEMMDHDSTRAIMGRRMMERPGMMGMSNDTTRMRSSVNQMIDMASKDSVMFNNMLLQMKKNPDMWRKVTRMNESTARLN